MYDRPETAADHDAFWTAIRDGLRDRGVAAPEALTRGGDMWDQWRSDALVLGQTCGLPYRAHLHGAVALVGTPDYGLEDTPPGYYRSVLVTRAGDGKDIAAYADRTLGYNGGTSHSGWAAPQIAAAARGFAFARLLATGGHLASARAVAEGRADIAAIDAVTWRGIQRWEGCVATALQVVDRTPSAPGLPYITALGRDAEAIATAIDDALAAGAGAPLGIGRLVRISADDYLAQHTPPPPDA